MNDLDCLPIPYLSDASLLARRQHLVQEIALHRRHQQQRRFALGGTGLIASAVIATVVALVGVGSAAPSAFAAWSPSPTTPTPGQIADTQAACAAGPTSRPPGVGPFPTDVSLTDTRGPFTLELFGVNTMTEGGDMCMSGPDGTIFIYDTGPLSALPGPGQIVLDRLQAESANGQPYTIAEGSTGSGVSASTLALSDGSHVVTTTGNGLFVAWWPGKATVTSAAVTASAGTSTETIDSPPRIGLR